MAQQAKTHNIILPMKDGGILDVNIDECAEPGCETCNYGSVYTRQVTFEMIGKTASVKTSEMYDFPIPVDFVMRTLLTNSEDIKKMKQDEFIDWFCEKVADEMSVVDYFGRKKKYSDCYGVFVAVDDEDWRRVL